MWKVKAESGVLRNSVYVVPIPRSYSAKTENTDWAAPIFVVVGALPMMRQCGSTMVSVFELLQLREQLVR